MKRLAGLFLRGLTFILPFALTVYALWWLLSRAERMFHWLWLQALPAEYYLTGFGLVLGVIAVAAVGALMNAFVGRWIVSAVEELLDRIPLVKTIYGSVRDLMSFFAGKKKGMGRVVTVDVAPDIRMLGFVTQEDAASLTGQPRDGDRIAVFLPMSYQIGGFMVFVPREKLAHVDMKVEDALRLAITAGITEEGGAGRTT
jgi:uncharacterized membrane protein